MRKEARYWIALSFMNGLGDVLIKSLFSRFRKTEDVFRASLKVLAEIEGTGEKTA